jgi:TonB-linked SusC/RagA family outer membrane protein
MNIMNIRITIVLLGMVFLSFTALQARDNGPSDTMQPDTGVNYFSEEETLVNIPFNVVSKETLPGFITTINPSELLPYDNVGGVNAILSGRTPGIIQGTNLHGLGNAVIFIDGLPGELSDVTIEEIEQITILKDANSAMFYGVQAGRGVIMITTRRGKIGKPRSEVIVDQGISSPISLPSFLDAATYMELYNEARNNDGLPPLYNAGEIDSTRNRVNSYRFPDTDYYTSEFLKSVKPFSSYKVNFSGGNQNTQYFLNAGLTRSGSLLAMGEKEQTNGLNVRSNVNFKVNDFMKAYIDIAGMYDISRGPNGDFWGDASTLRPNSFTPLIDSAMVTGLENISKPVYVQGGNLLGGTNLYTNNIYGNLLLSGYRRTFTSMLNYKTGVDVDLSSLAKGLSFKLLGSFTLNSNYTESQNNTYAVYQPAWTPVGTGIYTAALTKIGNDVSTGTQGVSNTYKRRRIGYYGGLDYNRTFAGQHAVSASLLAFSNFDRQTGTLYETKYHHLGSRLNYVLNTKYIIDFSSVVTSSLHLDKENRLGFSPSVGLGWVMSREDFMAGIDAIDFLKIKASTGSLKTDFNFSSYYLYRSSFSQGGSVTWNDNGRSNNARIIGTIGNSLLSYEKRNDINLGFEAILLNQSILVDANFFREKYSDKITQRSASTPEYLGGLLPYVNFGEDKYTGIDLGITYRKTSGSLGYELGGNITYLTSEVTKTDESWEYEYQYRAGKRTDGLWGLEAEGLFSDSADVADHESQSFGAVSPGDIRYIDQNGDGIIDQNDVVMIGNSIPDFSYGLHVHLTYGKLSLFALATGNSGSERYFSNDYYWVYGDMKYSEVVLDRWTEETAGTATYPRLTTGSGSNNFRNSTFWLYDNGRFLIDRVQLTYDLQTLLPGLKAQSLGLYVKANNLAMFAKNRDKIRLNYNAEPQYTSYSIGIRAIF